ncbi:hypothetical protein ACFSJU_14150 [Paradesertivirga mongoliensis]|uniref:WH2 domain-containing protein n=1 Tax=Paradesertivirga mongoliensis TaxID=2100740 RepID=A0ABW4ZNV9_9SPHI|nr:hypothetical protein [Pedobacter mongoliensis]
MVKVVTSPTLRRTITKYFSLTLKKTGSIMAKGIRCFTLFTTFLFFHFYAAFSQQKTYARLNLMAGTSLLHAIHTGKKLKSVQSNFNKVIDPDCGSGASAIQVRSGTSINSGSRVIDEGKAVDNDMSTYSTHHIEGHQIGVEVSQIISFTTTASASDIVKIYLSLKATLQNHDITAQAYYWVPADGTGNGTPVGPLQPISSISVLPSPPAVGTPTEIVFNPGVIFNRIKIGVTANSNGNHDADLNLHHVQLTPPPPTTEEATSGGESEFAGCEGIVTLAISNTSNDVTYKWYNSALVEIANGGSSIYNPALTPGTHVFHVSATKLGCVAESPKHKITVTVLSKPNTPAILITN